MIEPQKECLESIGKISEYLKKTFFTLGGKDEPIPEDRLPRLGFAAPGTWAIIAQHSPPEELPSWAGEYLRKYLGTKILITYPRLVEVMQRQPYMPISEVDVHELWIVMDPYMSIESEGTVRFFYGGEVKGLYYVNL